MNCRNGGKAIFFCACIVQLQKLHLTSPIGPGVSLTVVENQVRK